MRWVIPAALVLGATLPSAAEFSSSTGVYTLSPWVGRSVIAGEDPAELISNQNQAEPHLVRSPVTDDLLLATFQEARLSTGGANANGVGVSRDGGFSWERSLLPRLTRISNGPYYRATDPVVAIDREDRFFHQSLVAIDAQFTEAAVVVQRSDDRGLTWGDPVVVYTGTSREGYEVFPDKNWMTVNPYADTPTSGRLISTWTNFREITRENFEINDAPIMLSYSDDHGQTWTIPRFVTPEPKSFVSDRSFQGSQPIFLPDGSLLIVYHEFIELGGSLFVRGHLRASYSPDGGETFDENLESVFDNFLIYSDETLRNAGFLPSAAVARDTGDVFVALQARYPSASDRSRILLVRSHRNGTSVTGRPAFNWSEPIMVDDSAIAADALFATVAVTPDGQTVAISYYTRRNSGRALSRLDHYIARSFDGGETWSSERMEGDLRVTPSTFDASLATNTASGYMIGDYFGLAAPNHADDAFALCWIDTLAGTADPVTARVASVPDGYAAWHQVHFSFAERQARPVSERSDFDGDGLFDQLEAVLGFDPRNPDDHSRLFDSGTLVFGQPASTTFGFPQLQISRSTGDRPRQPTEEPLNPSTTDWGEGFWRQVSQPRSSLTEHFLFTLIGSNDSTRYALSGNAYPWRATLLEPGSDWFFSAWFGYGYDRYFPWVFHNGLGWLFAGSPSEERLWLYSPRYGWLFTSRLLYPHLFNASEDDWWRYLPSSLEAPRWFYSSRLKTWIQR